MRASDLQRSLQPITRSTTAVDAARLIAADRLAALVIADDAGVPVAVVSAVDVLGLLLPGYLIDDVHLAAVLDEEGANELFSSSAHRTIAELIDDASVRTHDLITVDADAALVEIAAQLAHGRAQIALVAGTTAGPRFVLLPDVMDAILTASERATGTEA